MKYGADRLFELADGVLGLGGADAIEVVLSRRQTALTRFADSRIHQNTSCLDGQARVRVVLDAGTEGASVGVATMGQLDTEGLREAAERARHAARAVPPSPGFGGLPDGDATYVEAAPEHPMTAGCPPEMRVDVVRDLLAQLSNGVTGAGAVETAGVELAVANNLGVRAYHAGSRAAASILASGPDSTGYAESISSALGELEPVRLGRRADEKVRLGAQPREVPPGTYPVVLEPAATAVLIHRLSHAAFGGWAVHKGHSPLAGRMGEQVCHPAVTIADDPLSSSLPGVPFDAEGTPKRWMPLIERGVAVGATYDRTAACAAGTEPTGHALLPPNPLSGLPTHLVMEPGAAEPSELVGGIERGLLITRFHYTNLVHPVRSTVTGTTRDGTFLVEDGQVVGGVRNLRFTESVLSALSSVEAVGREAEVSTERFYGDAAAPALRLSSFAFTSTSTH